MVDRSRIFWHYLRGTMLIDFASSIPIEVLVSATQGNGHESLGSLRALRVLRLTKLLRILRSNKILRRIEDHWHIHYSCASCHGSSPPPRVVPLGTTAWRVGGGFCGGAPPLHPSRRPLRAAARPSRRTHAFRPSAACRCGAPQTSP